WSSDVCSSDLGPLVPGPGHGNDRWGAGLGAGARTPRSHPARGCAAPGTDAVDAGRFPRRPRRPSALEREGGPGRAGPRPGGGRAVGAGGAAARVLGAAPVAARWRAGDGPADLQGDCPRPRWKRGHGRAGERERGVRGRASPRAGGLGALFRSEEHTSELQSRENLVCRLLLEKKNKHTRETKHTIFTQQRKRDLERCIFIVI